MNLKDIFRIIITKCMMIDLVTEVIYSLNFFGKVAALSSYRVFYRLHGCRQLYAGIRIQNGVSAHNLTGH